MYIKRRRGNLIYLSHVRGTLVTLPSWAQSRAFLLWLSKHFCEHRLIALTPLGLSLCVLAIESMNFRVYVPARWISRTPSLPLRDPSQCGQLVTHVLDLISLQP